MSVEEAYTRATMASRLKCELTVSSIDYLVAAGLVRDGLATRLLRLRSEFDTINRASLREADTPLTARLLTLMRLKSLTPARDMLGRYARESKPNKLDLSEKEVAAIAGRVLDLFVDPTCAECAGKGFTGNHGAPRIRCTHCRESGRRLPKWQSEKHEKFARSLQTAIDEKVSTTLRHMQKALRQH